MIDKLTDNNLIRARWNQDASEWSPGDTERHEAYFALEKGNCVLHMYREWMHDGPHWYPDGGKMYSRDYDFGETNIQVKEVGIPETVHVAVLSFAREEEE